MLTFLGAYLDAYDGNWPSLIQNLDPIVESKVNGFEYYKTCMRWLLASAYVETGDLQSAPKHFERIVAPKEFFHQHDTWLLPLHHSFAHQRLVLAHSKLGQIDEARNHWDHFERFSRPRSRADSPC